MLRRPVFRPGVTTVHHRSSSRPHRPLCAIGLAAAARQCQAYASPFLVRRLQASKAEPPAGPGSFPARTLSSVRKLQTETYGCERAGVARGASLRGASDWAFPGRARAPGGARRHACEGLVAAQNNPRTESCHYFVRGRAGHLGRPIGSLSALSMPRPGGDAAGLVSEIGRSGSEAVVG